MIIRDRIVLEDAKKELFLKDRVQDFNFQETLKYFDNFFDRMNSINRNKKIVCFSHRDSVNSKLYLNGDEDHYKNLFDGDEYFSDSCYVYECCKKKWGETYYSHAQGYLKYYKSENSKYGIIRWGMHLQNSLLFAKNDKGQERVHIQILKVETRKFAFDDRTTIEDSSEVRKEKVLTLSEFWRTFYPSFKEHIKKLFDEDPFFNISNVERENGDVEALYAALPFNASFESFYGYLEHTLVNASAEESVSFRLNKMRLPFSQGEETLELAFHKIDAEKNLNEFYLEINKKGSHGDGRDWSSHRVFLRDGRTPEGCITLLEKGRGENRFLSFFEFINFYYPEIQSFIQEAIQKRKILPPHLPYSKDKLIKKPQQHLEDKSQLVVELIKSLGGDVSYTQFKKIVEAQNGKVLNHITSRSFQEILPLFKKSDLPAIILYLLEVQNKKQNSYRSVYDLAIEMVKIDAQHKNDIFALKVFLENLHKQKQVTLFDLEYFLLLMSSMQDTISLLVEVTSEMAILKLKIDKTIVTNVQNSRVPANELDRNRVNEMGANSKFFLEVAKFLLESTKDIKNWQDENLFHIRDIKNVSIFTENIPVLLRLLANLYSKKSDKNNGSAQNLKYVYNIAIKENGEIINASNTASILKTIFQSDKSKSIELAHELITKKPELFDNFGVMQLIATFNDQGINGEDIHEINIQTISMFLDLLSKEQLKGILPKLVDIIFKSSSHKTQFFQQFITLIASELTKKPETNKQQIHNLITLTSTTLIDKNVKNTIWRFISNNILTSLTSQKDLYVSILSNVQISKDAPDIILAILEKSLDKLPEVLDISFIKTFLLVQAQAKNPHLSRIVEIIIRKEPYITFEFDQLLTILENTVENFPILLVTRLKDDYINTAEVNENGNFLKFIDRISMICKKLSDSEKKKFLEELKEKKRSHTYPPLAYSFITSKGTSDPSIFISHCCESDKIFKKLIPELLERFKTDTKVVYNVLSETLNNNKISKNVKNEIISYTQQLVMNKKVAVDEKIASLILKHLN